MTPIPTLNVRLSVSPTCSVRPATTDDALAIVEMALRFLRETPYGALLGDGNPLVIGAVLSTLLAQGIVLVAERAGIPVGFIAALAMQHPISGRMYGDEVAWWVEPEARNGRAGVMLLTALEEWARQEGLSLLKMVAPAESQVGTFLHRRGYDAVETAYQKRLEPDGRIHVDGAARRRAARRRPAG